MREFNLRPEAEDQSAQPYEHNWQHNPKGTSITLIVAQQAIVSGQSSVD